MELHRSMKLVEVFRELNPKMALQAMTTFLYVAQNDGTGTMKELAELMDVSQGSATRNVQIFLKKNRHGEAGFDMLDYREDPEHRSRKLLFLTPKGKDFARKLNNL